MILSSVPFSQHANIDTQAEAHIRRAGASDAAQIAAFVSRAHPLRRAITREEILIHFGKAGLLIAESDGRIVGLLGWQVENLVARITDFLVMPAGLFHIVGPALLTAMENSARELQCETAILLIPFKDPESMTPFWSALGYELHTVADLPRAWQDAALEVGLSTTGRMFVRKLRDERVLRPI